jgi:hypothetical protein
VDEWPEVIELIVPDEWKELRTVDGLPITIRRRHSWALVAVAMLTDEQAALAAAGERTTHDVTTVGPVCLDCGQEWPGSASCPGADHLPVSG